MEQPEGFSEAMKSRTAHLSQLTRTYNELERLMMSRENHEKVNEVYHKLCDRYELFKAGHLQCVDLCNDAEKLKSMESSFTSQVQNFSEFNERYSEWKKSSIIPEVPEEDCISVRTHVTNASSSRSSRSQMLSAKARRLIAEQKMKTLKEKQLLERQQRESEERMQIIDQQSEIDQARIEEQVWQEDDINQASGGACYDKDARHVTDACRRDYLSGDEDDIQARAVRSRRADVTTIGTDDTRRTHARVTGPLAAAVTKMADERFPVDGCGTPRTQR